MQVPFPPGIASADVEVVAVDIEGVEGVEGGFGQAERQSPTTSFQYAGSFCLMYSLTFRASGIVPSTSVKP